MEYRVGIVVIWGGLRLFLRSLLLSGFIWVLFGCLNDLLVRLIRNVKL